MYTPKTTPPVIFFFGIIFFAFGVILPASSGISPGNISITKGEILTYSTSPQIQFTYNGQEYRTSQNGSMSCNNRPCNQIGEKVTVIFDTNTRNIITLQELLFTSIFSIIGLIMMIGWIYAYMKSRKRRDTILSLQGLGAYTEATIIDMETVRSKGKNGGSRVVGYKYHCKDNKTGEEYDSDVIPMPIFEVGSSVRVVKDALNYPGLYWVDLNTVTQNQTSHLMATEYHEQKIDKQEEEIRKTISGAMGYGKSIFILWGLGLLFTLPAIFLGVFPLILLGVVFFGLGIWNISYFFREKRAKAMREKNITLIVTIQSIEKVGKWKMVPYGYIPPDEVKQYEVNVDDINDGVNPNPFQRIYGYQYRFQLNINGRVQTTEIFSKPLPKKYIQGAKIRVYFDDMSYSGEFFTDIASVDELN